jgi:hypothetical protein
MSADEHNECGCVRCTTGLSLEDIANVLAYHMIEMSEGDEIEMGNHVYAFGMLLISEIVRVMTGHDGDQLQ